jgi:hypothetical protein
MKSARSYANYPVCVCSVDAEPFYPDPLVQGGMFSLLQLREKGLGLGSRSRVVYDHTHVRRPPPLGRGAGPERNGSGSQVKGALLHRAGTAEDRFFTSKFP